MNFETWMKENFDEPEWDEGYTRDDMLAAYEAGKYAPKKSNKVHCYKCKGKGCNICFGNGFFEIVTR